MTDNIVLVTLDSLRADHCADNRLGAELAPTLRRLATEGVEYEYAITPGPRTPSAMPVVFTGEQLPPITEATGDFWTRRRNAIRRHMQRHRSIAERLQARGYHTIGVTANPWTQGTGFDRGFDTFLEINSGTLDAYGPPAFRVADYLLADTSIGDRLYWFNKREWFIRWTDFYDTILDRIEAASEPYFLWVFLLDTHQPYIVPGADREDSSALGMYYASLRELATSGDVPPWVDTRLRHAYHDSIRSVDRFLARLLTETATDDPTVVVHSDHGEAFGEHGTYGHEQRLYEENIRVPCIIHDGDARERLRDPLPTRRLPELVCDLATPGAFDPATYTDDYAVATVDDGHAATVTTRQWKLIHNRDTDDELYHLTHDPDEQRNQASEHPGIRDHLWKLVGRHQRHLSEQTRIADVVSEEAAEL